MDLKSRYELVCAEYIVEFCKKQEMDFDGWVGGTIGGIACCGDFFLNFSDITYDINTCQPPGLILKWYNDNLTQSAHRWINYHSYARGLRVEDID
jgi:hypothetical protein